MKFMRKNLFNKISEKAAHSLGKTSIKLSEQALKKSCFLGVYETKIPIELLKNSDNIK